jgi:hypothetical protein
MAASRIIVSENIEVPIVDGKMRCIRCKGWKLPGEMHSTDRTCQACYEDIKKRNANKPKPKKNTEKIIKRNAMGWVEREEKPTQGVVDPELARMLILERVLDESAIPDVTTRLDDDTNKPVTEGGVRVADTKKRLLDDDTNKPVTEDGVRVADTKKRLLDDDTNEPVTEGGVRVADTKKRLLDDDINKPVTEDGVRVADTKKRLLDDDINKPVTEDGVRVADTKKRLLDDDINKPVTEDGVRVADTKKRLSDLELSLSTVQEDLAYALREIASLKKQLGKLSPVIEREEPKRDVEGLKKLRDDLHKLLKERMEKSHTNGIYVHSLYGPNGRPGGKLNISKKQAFRLRDACRSDDRFRVEKANNQRGNWAISLNIHIN